MTHVDDLPDEEVWVSGGVRIPLVKMSDTHLRNATNYMKRKLVEAEGSGWELADKETSAGVSLELADMEDKLERLEGEVERRLNNGPQSLPITKTRQEAEEAYRRMRE